MKKKKDAGGEAAGGGQKGKLLPAVVVALGLIVAAKMMGGGGTAAPVAAEATTTTTEPEGPIVSLDPITVNTVDGRYVKAGIALQMALPEEGEEEFHLDPEADVNVTFAKALDVTLNVIGAKSGPELTGKDGHASLKGELTAALSEAYEGDIAKVWFTEFVVQ